MSKRYIEVDALKERLELVSVDAVTLYEMGFNLGLHRAEAEIELAPTADVVEVVRCRDCEYSYTDKYGRLMCHIRNGSYNEECDPNEFCSRGQRREQCDT